MSSSNNQDKSLRISSLFEPDFLLALQQNDCESQKY